MEQAYANKPVCDEEGFWSLDSRDCTWSSGKALTLSLAGWRILDQAYRFIINQHGELLAGEDFFFQPAVGGRDFKREDGCITPRLRGWVNSFRNLIQADEVVRVLLVPRRADEDHWLCQVVSLHETDPRLFGLSIHHAGMNSQPKWADVSIPFGLTPAEQEVLTALLCGNSPQAICHNWKVSINTIRTHVRHIHDKLDVRDQHQLWRKMIDYRVN